MRRSSKAPSQWIPCIGSGGIAASTPTPVVLVDAAAAAGGGSGQQPLIARMLINTVRGVLALANTSTTLPNILDVGIAVVNLNSGSTTPVLDPSLSSDLDYGGWLWLRRFYVAVGIATGSFTSMDMTNQLCLPQGADVFVKVKRKLLPHQQLVLYMNGTSTFQFSLNVRTLISRVA